MPGQSRVRRQAGGNTEPSRALRRGGGDRPGGVTEAAGRAPASPSAALKPEGVRGPATPRRLCLPVCLSVCLSTSLPPSLPAAARGESAALPTHGAGLRSAAAAAPGALSRAAAGSGAARPGQLPESARGRTSRAGPLPLSRPATQIGRAHV